MDDRERNIRTEAALHRVILNLISLIDQGNTEDIAEIINLREDGKVVKYLSDKYINKAYDWGDKELADEFIKNEAPQYDVSDARRKQGVINNGLCHLLGVAIEAHHYASCEIK